MEVLEDLRHVSKHLSTHTCTFNKSSLTGSSRVGVKMCTLTEGSHRSSCVVHERKKVYAFVNPTLLLGGIDGTGAAAGISSRQ